MKSFKKFLALALALALCFAMAVPAMATDHTHPDGKDPTYLKVSNPTTDHTYSVYQIFKGTVSEENGHLILSSVQYGANYYDSDKKVFLTGPVPADVLEYLETAGENAAIALAKQFYAVKDNIGDPVATLTKENNYETTVEPGYYLIIDNDYDGEDKDPIVDDTLSALIVQVVGPTDVKAKTTVPTFDKTTDSDADHSDVTDAAGHKIGEVFPFYLTANVPVEYLEKYVGQFDSSEKGYTGKYIMRFHDDMGDGLTFASGFKVVTGGIEQLDGTVLEDGTQEPDYESYTVTNNSKDANATDSLVGTAGAKFTLEIPDLFQCIGPHKEQWQTEEVDGVECVVVTVEYMAYLNENSKVNSTSGDDADPKNVNKAHLEYSRNPENSDETGNTPEEIVTIFTFDLDGLKVDEDEKPLAGAGFTLYQTRNDDGTLADPVKIYASASSESSEAETDEVDNMAIDPTYTYFVWDEDNLAEKPDDLMEVTNNEIITGKDGKFVINGLKPGTYYLSETTVPEGYNKINNIEIVVSVESYTENEQGKKIANLKVTKTYLETPSVSGELNGKEVDDNTVSTALTVQNKKGSFLPSTGGIGTTIFYAVGGVLVVGAGVLLFVRKRMGSKG